MSHDFIPPSLLASYEQFLCELEQLDKQLPTNCPHCSSKIFSQTRAEPLTFRCKACAKYFNPLTGTVFNRLQPVDWLATILNDRVNRETYQDIADKLACDIKKIMRRDKAIKIQMQLHFPELYQWYCAHNDVAKQFESNHVNETISAQHLAFKQKITQILITTKTDCLYCHSNKTVKIGDRVAFRCNSYRRGFNLLQGTPIWRLYHAEKWLTYLDLLVAKNSDQAIIRQLNFNAGTAKKWRRTWCETMQMWDFKSLAIWCKRREFCCRPYFITVVLYF